MENYSQNIGWSFDRIMTDPYFIDSWVDYCADCIRHGQKALFRRQLAGYIKETNDAAQRDLMKYVRGIQGEIWGEEIRMKARRIKYQQLFKANRMV